MVGELEMGVVDFGEFEQDWLDGDSDEENIETFELKALKILCAEMMDEVFDESSFPLNSELQGYKRKGKAHTKSCLRKTCKIRNPKILNKGCKCKESFGIAKVLVTWLNLGSRVILLESRT
jgi:hypothetical protein